MSAPGRLIGVWDSVDISLLFRAARVAFLRSLGQAAMFASTIYCTAFFAPSEYGLAGTFILVINSLGIVLSLRLENMALIAKDKAEEDLYVAMAYGVAGALTLAMTVAWSIASLSVASWSSIWIGYAVIWGALLNSIYMYILPAQMVAPSVMGRVGTLNAIIGVTTAAAQVLIATFSPTVVGLVCTRVVGAFLGINYCFGYLRQGSAGARRLSRSSVLPAWKKAAPEVLFNVPSSLVNSLSLQAPVLVLTLHSELDTSGKYLLFFNILFMPYTIVSASVRPQLLRSISQAETDGRIFTMLRHSTLVALGLALAYGVAAGSVVMYLSYLLPGQWHISPWVVLALVMVLIPVIASMPVITAVTVLRQQMNSFLHNVMLVLVRTAGLASLLGAGIAADTALFFQSLTGALVTLGFVTLTFRAVLKLSSGED